MLPARFHLFIAFAFTVMADPLSSVAYAIESTLIELDGNLAELFPTMALVIGTIVVIAATYHQLVRRFPSGGGGPEGIAAAFGDGWAFVPLGALLVDFTLTVAISSAAGASAVIAYAPELADVRVPLSLCLAAVVAAGICLGHRGRILFATGTLAFLLFAAIMIVKGMLGGVQAPAAQGGSSLVGDASMLPVLLAMPLGMALATGIEAPSNAIAQLGQLNDRGRRLFGQLTIWLMVAIVGALTLGIAGLAVANGIGLPPEDSTLLAEVARGITGDGAAFAGFQALSALLLLAAAGSSYLAASGLLKALALHGADGDGGLVPRRFAGTNRFFVPTWGVALILATSAALIVLAGGRDQEIVQFYAVAVFASFLAALAGCARLSWRDGRRGQLAINLLGLVLVVFVLGENLTRMDGAISMAATGLVALYLWITWVRRGRPGGVATMGRAVG